MNILGFQLPFSRRHKVPSAQKAAPGADPWLREAGTEPGPALTNAYQQVVWVYRAINVLAEQVANVPFRFSVGQAGGENLIHRGPLIDFYARPHPQIDPFQYWELRVIWLLLRGECFRIPLFRVPPGAPGGPVLASVLLLDPARFQHLVEDHQLIGWRYTGFGRQAPLASQVFLPEEVWFEKLPNPFDFWRGLSPLAVAGLAAQTDFAAGAYMKGFLENNADNGLIVRTNELLSDEQREQVLAELRARKRKAGLADRPVLLSQAAEVVQPALSSADLQFLENRKFSRGEICAAFGVPEEIVTTTDTAKYDVMAGARLNFIENRVAPLCRRLEAAEQVTVHCLDPQAAGWFDLDSLPILQQARRNRLAAAKTGFEMGVPFNELNRVFELGFKPLPWGDRGYLPAGLQALGEAPPAPAANAAPPALPAAAGDPDRLSRFLAGLLSPPPADAEAEAGAAPAVGSLPEPARPLQRKLSRFLFEQRGRVLARLAQARTAEPAFDLAAETALGLERLVPWLGATSAAFEPGLAAFNRTTLLTLDATLAEGRALAESPGPLAGRVRAVYRQADARAEALVCRSSVSNATLNSTQS